jgi:hypothetical protein
VKDVSFPLGESVYRFSKLLKHHSLPLAALIAAVVLAPTAGRATPYASSLTNAGGVISFRLNESADNVYIISDGGATTNHLGAMAAGLQSVTLSISGTFQVAAFKASPPGFATAVAPNRGAVLQIGTDTLLTRFNQPRGLTVNTNPASPAFGRVYVANGVAGTTTNSVFGANRTLGDGIYLLNPDLSDALGLGDTASTAGIDWVTGGTASPYRLSIGQDDNLYVADWSDSNGSLYVTDADVSAASGFNVLGGPKGSPFPVTATRIHGSIAAAVVEGSLAMGNLTAYVIDEDLQPDRASTTQNARNTLWRHDIGATLPGPEALPTRIGTTTPWINFASQTMDLHRGTNGYFYVNDNRSAGTDRGGLYVLDAAGTPLWNSLTASLAMGFTADVLRASGGGAISPRGDYVAVINLESNGMTVVPLIEGIPDLTNRLVFHGFAASSPQGRDVAFDIAGNLYAISQGAQALRYFSPGGTTTALTGSDGTFTIIRPPALSVAATDNLASETAPDTITFTISASAPVELDTTVTYTLTGTATNGTDYVTNTLSALIPAGLSSVDVVITPIDDGEAEFAESVIFTLQGGATYDLKSPVSATATIADNELPNVVTVAVVDANAYEGTPSDIITFRVTLMGETNNAPTVAFSFGAGTAVFGASGDFIMSNRLTGLSVDAASMFWEAGVVTELFTIYPNNNSLADGTRSVGMQLDAADAIPGTPGVAFATLRDDENFSACVLFSEDFDLDHSADWTTLSASTNGVLDSTVSWSYDYSALGIPAAPHGSGVTTRGLYVTVNKADLIPVPAAVNFYPNNKQFSGNYALQFDLYVGVGNSNATEHTLAGLNHSGNFTNWISQSATDAPQTAGNDGLFVGINASGGNLRDYALYTSTNASRVPALLVNRAASTLTAQLPAPPYNISGTVGNASNSVTKTWSTVELRQLDGKVSLIINATNIIERTNDTAFQSGNIMIGYNDQFASRGSDLNYAIFDNVRVVSLDFVIKNFTRSGNTIDFDFYSPLGGKLSDFRLQTASDPAPGNWTDDNSATIFEIPGGFHVNTTALGNMRFFKMRR